MTSWVPTTDFENEIINIQPEHNFIFPALAESEADAENYPRPKDHFEQKKLQKKSAIPSSHHNQKLRIISKVQRITGTKKLGEQPTDADWDTNDHLERETIALMRSVGLRPSIEAPLDERNTIATLPITEEVCVVRSGIRARPVFFDEKFFKLRPRVLTSSSSGVETGSAENLNVSSASLPSGDGAGADADISSNSEKATSAAVSHDGGIPYEKLQNASEMSSDLGSSYFATAASKVVGSSSDASYHTACNNHNENNLTFTSAPSKGTAQRFITPKQLYQKKRVDNEREENQKL